MKTFAVTLIASSALTAGCTSSTKPTASTLDNTHAARRESAPACPTGGALAEKLGALFQIAPERLDTPACIVGAFPRPGWFVSAYTKDDEAIVQLRGVVYPDGQLAHVERERVDQDEEDRHSMYGIGDNAHRVVDFNGDGIDEVVYSVSLLRRHQSTSSLVVLRLVEDTWDYALFRTFEFSNDDEAGGNFDHCDGTWKLEDRAIVFERTGTGSYAEPSVCVTERESWNFGATGTFVKVATEIERGKRSR